MKRKVGIVGFRGYSGAEAQAILARHPGVETFLLEHRQDAGERPVPRRETGPTRIPCTAASAGAAGLDAVLLATAPDVSMNLTPGFLEAGLKVIDLSGAYRLKTVENFQRWYKEPHEQPELLAQAAYGLPEFYREQIRGAHLISNPGCYPTAANLAVQPLVKAGILDRDYGVICDAKSGVSGAGRKPSLKTSFCEVSSNFSVYSVLHHRHVPEVLQNSGLAEPEFSFTAQLLPLERGILETIYVRLQGIRSAADLLAVYEQAYAHEPFVRLYDPGQLPDIRSVAHTNFCDIGFVYDANSRRAVIVTVIDNLGKGAAGQAVQNLNLVLGFPEAEALTQ